MSLKDMQAVAEKASRISSAQSRLQAARSNLQLVNKFGKEGLVWRPTIRLHKGDYYGRDVDISIDVPFGVIQQQAVYAVEKEIRAIIADGGSIEDTK